MIPDRTCRRQGGVLYLATHTRDTTITTKMKMKTMGTNTNMRIKAIIQTKKRNPDITLPMIPITNNRMISAAATGAGSDMIQGEYALNMG